MIIPVVQVRQHQYFTDTRSVVLLWIFFSFSMDLGAKDNSSLPREITLRASIGLALCFIHVKRAPPSPLPHTSPIQHSGPDRIHRFITLVM